MPPKLPPTALLSVGAIFAAGLLGATAWTQNKAADHRRIAYRMDYMARVKGGYFEDYVQYWQDPKIASDLTAKTSYEHAVADDSLPKPQLDAAMQDFQARSSALWGIQGSASLPHLFETARKTRHLEHAQYSVLIPWSFYYYPHNTGKIIEFGVKKWPTADRTDKYVLADWSNFTYPMHSDPIDPALYKQWLQASVDYGLKVKELEWPYPFKFIDPQLLGEWSKGQDTDEILKWLQSTDLAHRRFAMRFISGFTESTPGYQKTNKLLDAAVNDSDPLIKYWAQKYVNDKATQKMWDEYYANQRQSSASSP